MLRTDEALQHDVTAEIACDLACQNADIGVQVKNGVVTLSGVILDARVKNAALKAVRRVYGVDGVDPRFAMPDADVEIATKAAQERVFVSTIASEKTELGAI